MKTIIDAVNEFKGEWPESEKDELVTTSDNWDGGAVWAGTIQPRRILGIHGSCQTLNDASWVILCTQSEFNKCVEEMTDGTLWASRDIPLTYTFSDELKITPAVTELIINNVYTQELSDAGVLPSVGSCAMLKVSTEYLKIRSVLAGQSVYITSHFKTNGGKELCSFVNHEESDGGVAAACAFEPLPTPIELEDGEPYTFTFNGKDELKLVAFYIKELDSFGNNLATYHKNKCTNIVKLVPES